MRWFGGAPSARDQSNTSPEPGLGPSMSTAWAPSSRARSSSGSPATNALIKNPTRSATHRLSSTDSRPWSCAPRRPQRSTVCTTCSRLASRNTPTVMVSGGRRRRDLAHTGRRDLPGRRGEDEADGVGAHGDRQECILLAADPADLDEHGDDATAHRSPVGTQFASSSRKAAVGSAAVTSDSPTNTAWKPAAAARRASSAPRMPDSATRIAPSGRSAAIDAARS